MTASEKRVMDSQSVMQKNSKTGLPSIKLFLIDIDKATKYASSCFCGYHPDKPKWAFVRYMYGVIASDPRALYYENIRFKYILPEKISSIKSFSPERSTIIVFEDLLIIHENLSHLLIFNEGSSYQDVSKIIGRYADDIKNASMVINSYLRKNKFIVFDLTRSEDDLLAIRLRFNTLLDLQKEIELH
ncbi:12119_t:CDS:2 [Cetraspora pellucida]|uniref:12119_t:CDS:1 n=1 Tax=Cetraspora pellucida TaxID=1433469 RepID=A0A9N9FJC6_9GLOM|nr:12119_t:CDS:2 [Cetraspora pellucida]